MRLNFFVIIFGITLTTTAVFAQEINQTDASGERHGLWEKYYPESNQLRFAGEFHHGKERGKFKFYCQTCGDQPSAIIDYGRGNDIAKVKYLDLKGKVISEGKMKHQKRMGEWVYYHKDSDRVMSQENYSDGVLHGMTTTYYPNGKITEETEYKLGVKDGKNNFYSSQGVLIRKLIYQDDKLHGPAFYYDAHGQLTIEGAYKAGRKDGLWKYYENGKVVLEETYPIKYDNKPRVE